MVKPGYKQTEVGEIPEDWDVKFIGDIADVKTGPFGSALHEKDYVNEGTPIITVEHLGELGITSQNLPRVSEVDRNRLSAYSLKEGDIVFSRVGSIDRNAIISVHEDGWLFSGRLLRVRLKGSFNSSKYLSFHFHSRPFKNRVLNVAVGQTMASLNTEILKGISIVVPKNKTEQNKIAKTLSDTNNLIKALEKLIAKKQDIKTATMQQLLTGKKRLHGFNGKWNKIRIEKDAILKARIGWQALTTKEYLDSGDFYLVTGTDFIGGRVDWSTCHFVDEWRYNQDRNIQLKSGDVLLTKDGTIGKVGYVDQLDLPATLNSGVFVIRPIGEKFYPLFLYYILSSRIFDDFLSQITAGSTITHLYQKDFVNFEFLAPTLDEQKRIAEILDSMDSELIQIQDKLEKFKKIKQGMMQELLTGRTRLI